MKIFTFSAKSFYVHASFSTGIFVCPRDLEGELVKTKSNLLQSKGFVRRFL